MNFRNLTQKYLGWCPGVNAASRFLPDKEISSNRLTLLVVLASMIAFSGYTLTKNALTMVDVPSQRDVPISYENPVLAVRFGQLYLAEVVRVGGPLDVGTRYVLFLSELSQGGAVSDAVILVDTPLQLEYDVAVTKDGHFYVAYTQSSLSEVPKRLTIIESSDGVNWSETELAFSGYIREFTLTETTDGHPFLFVYSDDRLQQSGDVNPPMREYTFSTCSDDNWAPFEVCPFDIDLYRLTSATDGGGNIHVTGLNSTFIREADVTWDDSFLTLGLDKDGEWTEPRTLKLGEINQPVEYREPDLLYSHTRDGFYFAFVSYTPYTVHIKFSKDLEHWEDAASFQPGSDPSMGELADGTILAVFKDEHTAREIRLSRSVDGFSWTAPQKVDVVPLDDLLDYHVSWKRGVVSSIIGAVLGVVSFSVLFKRSP